MDEATRQLYRIRGLGRPQGAGRRPCLLIVDLSYGFTDPASPLGCDADMAISVICDLLQAAREADVPRVFTRIEYDDAGLVAASRFLEKMPALGLLRPGERLAAIDERVAPQIGEPVLTKLFASAFYGTPLAALLAGYGCDTVIVTGASTSGCVRATAVDALQHGYAVIVPREAVADRAQLPHEAALFDIEAKYGNVREASDVLRLLREADPTVAPEGVA